LIKIIKINRELGNKGFSLIEVFIALFLSSLIIGIMIGIYSLSVGKTSYINKDSNILRFESNISDWIEKDFRTNRVLDVSVDSANLDVLTLDLGNNESIKYEDRANGFYRVENIDSGQKSVLITEEDINEIIVSDNKKVITIEYGSIEFNKEITILLNK
jgi:hypothetical protein